MKKAIKSILLTVLGILLVLALLGAGLVAFVSWVWGGVRFSPEDAMEAVGIGSSKRAYIEAENCRFYYETVAELYETSGDSALTDAIVYVTPVVKNGIGMWHAIPAPKRCEVCIAGSEECVGTLVSHASDGIVHNFFLPSTGGTNPPSFHKILATDVRSVTVEGSPVALFKHSYFTTASPVSTFEINGTLLDVQE